MQGVANLRPCFPKYNSVWDVKLILDKYRNMPDDSALPLKDLTIKVTVLFCLVLCQREQTIHTFDIRYIKFAEKGIHIAFPSKLKQTRPSFHLRPIFIKDYPVEPSLCTKRCLLRYIEVTKPLRGDVTQLLLSYIKPHNAIGYKTVSRWLKQALQGAGIDIGLFQGHSVRVAGSSSAKHSGVPIQNILKMGGWSSEHVFARHYDKPIIDVTIDNLTPSVT